MPIDPANGLAAGPRISLEGDHPPLVVLLSAARAEILTATYHSGPHRKSIIPASLISVYS